jgi:hypothetical protein
LSVFIVGGTMSLNHATTVAFMRPRLSHAWDCANTIYCRCLTPLSMGNDTRAHIVCVCWPLISVVEMQRGIHTESLRLSVKPLVRIRYAARCTCVCVCVLSIFR